MDLQNFNSESLYFEKGNPPGIDRLLKLAADQYGEESEGYLAEALEIEPENLSVLIGLYRFYYYQHRYEDALETAGKVMAIAGKKIEFPGDWRDVTQAFVAHGASISFTFLRLYFFSLKAAGYVNLRRGRLEEGREMLEKVVAMDHFNRIGAQVLLDVITQNQLVASNANYTLS